MADVYERITSELLPPGWDYEQHEHFYMIMLECDGGDYDERVMAVPYDGLDQSIAKAAIRMLERDDPSIAGDYWVSFCWSCGDPSHCDVCIQRERDFEAAARQAHESIKRI
ncbi:hypothetical protein QKT49_gp268 [Acanthamoeba castellanii medusavirus]|uniref:Uncharacterized protein n=1 Tax=Acanthamoeba castellanii medusavirus J1 TaxID=3114988 RepID=A0A3T1CXH8_9VIRU|nr:hypothetical protein QKT49_gp268 [Acanthamoeba castellanii medusavirus]BBI30495.1 hypothetical protein [Acanthamoeba castellanii medusavirus J1]